MLRSIRRASCGTTAGAGLRHGGFVNIVAAAGGTTRTISVAIANAVRGSPRVPPDGAPPCSTSVVNPCQSTGEHVQMVGERTNFSGSANFAAHQGLINYTSRDRRFSTRSAAAQNHRRQRRRGSSTPGDATFLNSIAGLESRACHHIDSSSGRARSGLIRPVKGPSLEHPQGREADFRRRARSALLAAAVVRRSTRPPGTVAQVESAPGPTSC